MPYVPRITHGLIIFLELDSCAANDNQQCNGDPNALCYSLGSNLRECYCLPGYVGDLVLHGTDVFPGCFGIFFSFPRTLAFAVGVPLYLTVWKMLTTVSNTSISNVTGIRMQFVPTLVCISETVPATPDTPEPPLSVEWKFSLDALVQIVDR